VDATCTKRACGSAHRTDSSATSTAWRSDLAGKAAIIVCAATRTAGAICGDRVGAEGGRERRGKGRGIEEVRDEKIVDKERQKRERE
jgi:hypothetical protein